MIRFQTATPINAPEIANLVNSAYRGEYSKQGWTTEATILGGQRTDAAAILALINAPLNQVEIAYEQDQNIIIGSVHLIQETPNTIYFGMLTVEPKIQAKGIGKILLNHIENVAIGYGYKRIRFTVIPTRTELVAFYERRGFNPTGKFEPFPDNEPKFGRPKISGLILKEYEKFI